MPIVLVLLALTCTLSVAPASLSAQTAANAPDPGYVGSGPY
jgi:hypothetical protein